MAEVCHSCTSQVWLAQVLFWVGERWEGVQNGVGEGVPAGGELQGVGGARTWSFGCIYTHHPLLMWSQFVPCGVLKLVPAIPQAQI